MEIAHYAVMPGVNFETVDVLTADEWHNKQPRFKTGLRVRSTDGGEFMYVRYASAVTEAQFAVLSYNTTDSVWEATAVTTTNADALLGNLVGIVCPNDGAASGSYGWVQVLGLQSVLVANSCGNNVQLNTTATAGVADDDGTANATYINGVVLREDAAGADGPHKVRAFLNYPSLGTEDPS